jgi:hypothetical protein
MAFLDDLRLHFHGAGNGRVEVVDFKPQQDTVAVGFGVGIADWTMVVFDIPAVQLQVSVPFETNRSYSGAPCVLRQPRRRWYQWLLASTSVTAMRG